MEDCAIAKKGKARVAKAVGMNRFIGGKGAAQMRRGVRLRLAVSYSINQWGLTLPEQGHEQEEGTHGCGVASNLIASPADSGPPQVVSFPRAC